MRRRSFEDEEDEAEGADELNLTPYLDMITTLVIFFVFTFQIVVEFRLIDVAPPEISNKPSAGANAENAVNLSLFITTGGYVISADGRAADGTPVSTRAVVEKKDDAYQTALLHDRMVELKHQYGIGESLILVAHEKVEYKDVIAAMDAVRRSDKGLLFPDVVFGEPFGDESPAAATPAASPGATAPTGG